jgi:hypothetical protein
MVCRVFLRVFWMFFEDVCVICLARPLFSFSLMSFFIFLQTFLDMYPNCLSILFSEILRVLLPLPQAGSDD